MDYLLAFVLLQAPEQYSKLPARFDNPDMRAFLQRVSLEVEAYDSGEWPNFERGDLAYAWEQLRYRFHELRTCPPLADAAWLPHPDVAQLRIDNLRADLRSLEAQEDLLPPSRKVELATRLDYVRNALAVWCLIHSSQNPSFTRYSRRLDLRTLRDVVGYDAYYAGEWP
jgi:hypothetical protein